MAQYNNSTNTPEEWKFDYDSIPVREGLIVVFVFLLWIENPTMRA